MSATTTVKPFADGAATESTRSPHDNPWLHTFAASSAGFVTSIYATPFDVVKTRMQVQVVKRGSDPSVFYKGTLDTFVKVVRSDGIRVLWRGLSPALAISVPSSGVYITAYNALRTGIENSEVVSKGAAPAIAGITARLAAAFVTCPIEVLRTNFQARSGRQTQSYASVAVEAVRSKGFRAMWTGLGATLLRDLPFSGIFWYSYEWGKSSLIEFHRSHKDKHVSDQEIIAEHWTLPFVSAAASGAFAGVVTNPVDVIKSRQQAHLTDSMSGSSIRTVLSTMLREEGYTSLMKGWSARVVKAAPACAVMLGCYELFKTWYSPLFK